MIASAPTSTDGGIVRPSPFRGLHVDDEFVLGGLLDRQVGGLAAFEDLVHVRRGPAKLLGQARSVGNQAAGIDELSQVIQGRQAVLGSELDETCSRRQKHRIQLHVKRSGTSLNHGGEGVLELGGGIGLLEMQLHAERTRGRLGLSESWLEPRVRRVH